MLNNVMLVGRLASDIKIEEKEGKKVSCITVAVNRPYKNAEGIYETDFVDCILWGELATNTEEYCKKGDVIGIRGRLQTENNQCSVVVEKLTFLSSSKE